MIQDRERFHRLRWIRFLIVAGLSVMALNNCATLDQIIRKPTVAFDKMNLVNADLLQATAVFSFNVSNPNPISIRASSITYDLKLNGLNFVAGKLDQGVTVSAGSTSSISIPVKLRYLDFFESIAQIWETKGADYTLTGGFSVGPFRIPFNTVGRFDLPKMPQISLEAIQVDQFSIQGARLNCRLKMDNPNPFKLPFKRLNYNLNLGGTPFAKASTLSLGPVASKGRNVVNLGMDVSFFQLGQSAYQLLQGTNTDFLLHGGIILDSPTGIEHVVPLKLAGQVPFVR